VSEDTGASTSSDLRRWSPYGARGGKFKQQSGRAPAIPGATQSGEGARTSDLEKKGRSSKEKQVLPTCEKIIQGREKREFRGVGNRLRKKRKREG